MSAENPHNLERRSLFSAAVALLLLGGATTAATESTLANAASFPECATCEACDPPTYMANYVGEMGEENAPFFCGHGTCQGGCQFALDPTVKATVIQAATDGRSALLHRLIESYPDKIRLHTTRSAIQIVGCDGRVDTHIPLPDQAMGELLAHE